MQKTSQRLQIDPDNLWYCGRSRPEICSRNWTAWSFSNSNRNSLSICEIQVHSLSLHHWFHLLHQGIFTLALYLPLGVACAVLYCVALLVLTWEIWIWLTCCSSLCFSFLSRNGIRGLHLQLAGFSIACTIPVVAVLQRTLSPLIYLFKLNLLIKITWRYRQITWSSCTVNAHYSS